jgi:hypothetical protein
MDEVGSDAFLGDNGEFAENWLNNLPEDTFEKDDTGKPKTGDLANHKGIASVVKSYLNKDKLIGKSIQPLPEGATEEQVKTYRAKVGCPETAEGYEVKPPENLPEGLLISEEILKEAANYAHANHIPKTVYEGLAKIVLDSQIKMYGTMVEAAKKESDKTAEEASNKLKGEWGAGYDKNVELARRGYDLYGGREFVDLMESTGLKDNAIIVKTFLEIYKETHPKEFVTGESQAGKTTVPGQLDYSNVVGDSGR